MPFYDSRVVLAHGSSKSTVFLVNEAPGPVETHFGIPSVGQQGANIYAALRRAEVPWAIAPTRFIWPAKILECYKSPTKLRRRFELRDEFLETRAQYITCSNAYPRWPRSDENTRDWIAPDADDVRSESNLARLQGEVHQNQKVILVCGAYAWIACFGTSLSRPSDRECSELSTEELAHVNLRLSSGFLAGWYMGHTRRWSLNAARTSATLKEAADAAGWGQ